MKKLIVLSFALCILMACDKDEEKNIYVDGAYKAVEAEYGYGWKGFLSIEINKDKLTSVDFDYTNEEGKLKSETTAEEYPMPVHPNIWLPQYEASLLSAEIENFTEVDAISGATHSGETVNVMMKALLDAAKEGDNSDQIISE